MVRLRREKGGGSAETTENCKFRGNCTRTDGSMLLTKKGSSPILSAILLRSRGEGRTLQFESFRI